MNPSLPILPFQDFETTLAGQKIWVITQPGLPHGDGLSPAVELLAENVHLQSGGHCLILGCGNGTLGSVLAHRYGSNQLVLTDIHYAALQTAEQAIQRNQLTNAQVSPIDQNLEPGFYDTIVMDIPKGRKLARRWLVEAHGLLKPGGQIYLAGANAEGIQSIIKDACEIFGNGTVLGYKKGHRAARLVKSATALLPTWANEPGIATSTWVEFPIEICGAIFNIRSLPGIFSYDQLDEGTRLLLENLYIPAGARVLDFGCGYGIIGLFAARKGAISADLIDVNLLAVAASRENIYLNHIFNARAFPSNILNGVSDQHYSLIIANPPFHAGKRVDYSITQAFLSQAYHILEPGGQLVIVANRFIRYEQYLQPLFTNMLKVIETEKYHILSVVK